MKNTEIERKFLVDKKNLPNLSKMVYRDIVQGYIQKIGGDYIYRLRQCLHFSPTGAHLGEQYFQTIKGKEFMIREEYEIELLKSQFSTIWPLCKNLSVNKKRYEIVLECCKIRAYLDIYKNTLSGLYTIEVEFDDEVSCKEFIKPNWFGLEVTQDYRYSNFNLAIDGIPHNLNV